MSPENLLRIGRIRAHATDRTEIGKLLKAAARNLKDAGNTDNSNAVRFNCAYTAIMQLSQAALFANGYRPNTSEGGHHVTMVQALVHTIGLEPARMQVLDAHRRKRNVIDYSGDDAEPRGSRRYRRRAGTAQRHKSVAEEEPSGAGMSQCIESTRTAFGLSDAARRDLLYQSRD